MTLDELREKARLVDRETPMVIRADRDIRLQKFVDVLDIINNLGFRKVAIQTEKGSEQ
jgi:biopolymer transport protein ExbD